MGQARQKFLGVNGLIIFIALLNAFVPLSTDLYLPALPGMSAYFGTSADRINLTLTTFFIFYALGTLVWGPLSDHYGRKPVLIVGMGLYVIASDSCALMRSVDGLVLCRILQAIGGSAAFKTSLRSCSSVGSHPRRICLSRAPSLHSHSESFCYQYATSRGGCIQPSKTNGAC
jgi:DHA1 family bicyclomycin/chloramphenicol resistance-like MFS transporter